MAGYKYIDSSPRLLPVDLLAQRVPAHSSVRSINCWIVNCIGRGLTLGIKTMPAAARSAAHLRNRHPGTYLPQQGRLCSGQHAGAHLLCQLAQPRVLSGDPKSP